MTNFKDGNLEIKIQEGPTNNMSWVGKSESRDPSAILNPYFEGILDDLKGKELNIEFTNLEYMNSSTVPPIIQLIKNLNSNEIKSVIYYNKDSKWQAASFKALETIVRSMDYVDVIGK